MGYKVNKIYVGDNLVWPEEIPVYFDFGDWTNSTWTSPSSQEGTTTKTSSYVSFYKGNDYTNMFLTQYPIDGTKDFLLEFNGNLPSTNLGFHEIGLKTTSSTDYNLVFHTNRESYNTFYCRVLGSNYSTGQTNPGTANYFIRKQGGVLTMGRNGTTYYTGTPSISGTYYLAESAYRSTVYFYTAKLTYL